MPPIEIWLDVKACTEILHEAHILYFHRSADSVLSIAYGCLWGWRDQVHSRATLPQEESGLSRVLMPPYSCFHTLFSPPLTARYQTVSPH